MIYTYEINGVQLKTGDLICTQAGAEDVAAGHFWWFIGRLLPGEVDHVAVYVGPGGRCVESATRGVVAYTIPGTTWNAAEMFSQRGPVVDTFIGAAYPLNSVDWPQERKDWVRQTVADYCLTQAETHKPYNFNYLESENQGAFYCSQLAYLAYLPHGINLNTGLGMPNFPASRKIIFPQEIWSGLPHKKAEQFETRDTVLPAK